MPSRDAARGYDRRHRRGGGEDDDIRHPVRIAERNTFCEIVSETADPAAEADGRPCLSDLEFQMLPPFAAPSRPRRLVSSTFLVCFLGSIGATVAADRPKAPLGDLALSARLADWGRDDRNPLALIVAAQIRRDVAATPVERTPEASGETVAAPASGATETTAQSLLAEAIALSKNDPTIVALADDLRASATKGLVQGAGESRATLRPTGTDWYRGLRFEGSRYAEALVELSAAGDVLVSVWDQAGNLVCRDTNPSKVAYCGWVPSQTAQFDVKVENRSTRAVPYRMYTN